MIPNERKFKEEFVKKLNKIKKGWIDGDIEQNKEKRVDVVNHNLKIAIEIKDDTKYTAPRYSRKYDLTKMNERFADHIRSAHRKFKEYPQYKTVLLFRTAFPIPEIICYAIKGLCTYKNTFGEGLEYIGRNSKYSAHIRQEKCIGVV